MKKQLFIFTLLILTICSTSAIAKSGMNSLDASFVKIENEITQKLDNEGPEEEKEIESMGIASIVCGLTIVLSPVAIMLGIASLITIKKSPKRYKAKELGVIGIALGIVGICLIIVSIAFLSNFALFGLF